MKLLIYLLLSSQVEWNCQELFISQLPRDCRINNWDMWQITHQENLKFRKREWKRFKQNLPLTRDNDLLIKQIEEISKQTGYIIK